MKEDRKTKLFRTLSKLFSQPYNITPSKILSDYRLSHNIQGSLNEFFKETSSLYSMYLTGYQISDRIARYSDFNEMDASYPEIHAALNIVADETTTLNNEGEILTIKTEDEQISQMLKELFFVRLNLNYNLWSWVRNMLKFGDFYALLNISPTEGVLNHLTLPVNEIEKEETANPDTPAIIETKYRWTLKYGKPLSNYEIINLCLLSNDAFKPYGTSFLEAARRTFRQLTLMEDAMMVYRIVRAPERRVFYIEVGAADPNDVPTIIEQAKEKLKSQSVVDSLGRVENRFQAMDVTTDYFIPKRGDVSSRIDTLQGGTFTGDVEDVEFLKNKLFAALQIPKAYLQYLEDLAGKATLCIHPESTILLADGRIQTVSQIIEQHNKGEKLYAYGYDIPNNTLTTDEIVWAGYTKQFKEWLKITVNDEYSFEVSLDHPLMMYSGDYVQAQNCNVGDCLNGINLHKVWWNKIAQKRNLDYLYAHYNDLDQNEIFKAIHSLVPPRTINKKVYQVKHHKDRNRYNNVPGNLEIMPKVNHGKIHEHTFIKKAKPAECISMKLLPFLKKSFEFKHPNFAITKIEKIQGECLFADLHMKNHHNFLMIQNAGIVNKKIMGVFVHNSQMDIRFSKTVQRIQRHIVSELTKVALVHLMCKGVQGSRLLDFELQMNNPSNLEELQKLELWRSRLEIARDASDSGLSKTYIQKNMLNLSEEEIEEIKLEQLLEARFAKVIELEAAKVTEETVEEDKKELMSPKDEIPGLENLEKYTEYDSEKEAGISDMKDIQNLVVDPILDKERTDLF